MGIKRLARLEADTITERPVKIPYSFDNKDSLPKGKDPGECIVIRPITVRTWFRIRPFLLAVSKDDLDKLIAKDGEINSEFAEIMDKYSDIILDIVCLGIHNKPSEPPIWFREVLMDNSTWEDIAILLNAILYRIGYYPFCKSITILRNVSPLGEAEIIAAQKNLQSWSNAVKEDFS